MFPQCIPNILRIKLLEMLNFNICVIDVSIACIMDFLLYFCVDI